MLRVGVQGLGWMGGCLGLRVPQLLNLVHAKGGIDPCIYPYTGTVNSRCITSMPFDEDCLRHSLDNQFCRSLGFRVDPQL